MGTAGPHQESLDGPIVIVGGGHAAAQLCASLADAGLGPRVHLVCAEARLPYQRPPLSKAFLRNPDEALATLRPEAWFRDAGIRVHLGDAAQSIDRAARRLRLQSGTELAYGQLVLATGARARLLPGPTGLPEHLSNVAALRSADDALRLRAQLAAARRLTVLGGGFIGLEIAATARAAGLPVTVLEAAPRLLTRSVSADLAEHVLQTHRASGIDLRLGVTLGEFDLEGDRLAALHVGAERLGVGLLVLGVGAVPETTLAEAAGLPCDQGIRVDAHMRSADPAILAIGDCARFPAHARAPGGADGLRLESVQNANDQARTAAATLQGRDEPYQALPWFWSDQGGLRLQMAGLMPAPGDAGVARHRRPGATPASFSILHYVGERLACVESANAPLDHMAARKLLEAGKSPPPASACDPALPLKSLV